MASNSAAAPAPELFDGIDRELILTHLNAYIDRKGSQAKAGASLDISTGSMSQIVNRKWESISPAMWRKIAMAVLPSKWKLVKTGNLESITATLADCQEHSLMRWISGYSGAGKTTAMRHYTRENRNVAYVLCLESMSVRDLMQKILSELGISFNGTKYGMLNRIAEALLALDKPLLLLDDAGKLHGKKLHLVQQLYDLTEGQCGIALAGVDYAYDNLVQAAKAQRMGAPELKRRVGYNQKLKPPKAAEIEAIAVSNGVEDPEVVRVLQRHCKDFGTLRDTILNYRRLPNPSATALEQAIGTN